MSALQAAPTAASEKVFSDEATSGSAGGGPQTRAWTPSSDASFTGFSVYFHAQADGEFLVDVTVRCSGAIVFPLPSTDPDGVWTYTVTFDDLNPRIRWQTFGFTVPPPEGQDGTAGEPCTIAVWVRTAGRQNAPVAMFLTSSGAFALAVWGIPGATPPPSSSPPSTPTEAGPSSTTSSRAPNAGQGETLEALLLPGLVLLVVGVVVLGRRP